MQNVDILLEHYRKQLGITEEQEQALIEEHRAKNPIPRLEMNEETIGNALVVTFQNDNQLGELVMSLFLQVNDLAMMVMQLQSELEAMKNA